MNTTITTPARTAPHARADNTDKARELIELGLALDPRARSETLARLIAASLHEGLDTALCFFAGTGELLAQAALNELNSLTVPIEQEGWVDALGHYIVTKGDRS